LLIHPSKDGPPRKIISTYTHTYVCRASFKQKKARRRTGAVFAQLEQRQKGMETTTFRS
ncbi:hypothetical protein COCVIDRAFT_115705, partial [Bipolaris victoriae FI3]